MNKKVAENNELLYETPDFLYQRCLYKATSLAEISRQGWLNNDTVRLKECR